MKTIKGILHLFSETGTEGGYWAIQDENFIFPPTETWPHGNHPMAKKSKKSAAHPPDQSIIATLEGLRKEVADGVVLIPQYDVDYVWNTCTQRILHLIEKYEKGEGLFQ